jgi:hypothetical protein
MDQEVTKMTTTDAEETGTTSESIARPDKGIWRDEAAATEATEEPTDAADEPDEDTSR